MQMRSAVDYAQLVCWTVMLQQLILHRHHHYHRRHRQRCAWTVSLAGKDVVRPWHSLQKNI